jgi:hypothetical protein
VLHLILDFPDLVSEGTWTMTMDDDDDDDDDVF